jgi:hypothetical protein
MMTPEASPGGYSGGSMAGCNYGQFKVDQTPKYDNQVRKRKRKKKKGEK